MFPRRTSGTWSWSGRARRAPQFADHDGRSQSKPLSQVWPLRAGVEVSARTSRPDRGVTFLLAAAVLLAVVSPGIPHVAAARFGQPAVSGHPIRAGAALADVTPSLTRNAISILPATGSCTSGSPPPPASSTQQGENLTLGAVGTDLWGIGAGGTGSVSMCPTGLGLSTSVGLSDVVQTGGVDGYPNVNYGECVRGSTSFPPVDRALPLPMSLSQVPQLWGTTSFAIHNPGEASADMAYDIWLTPSVPSGSYCESSNPAFVEVMIWFYWSGTIALCARGCDLESSVPTTEFVNGSEIPPFDSAIGVHCNSRGVTLDYAVGESGSAASSATLAVDLRSLVLTALGYAASCPVFLGGTYGIESLKNFYLDSIDFGSEFSGATVGYDWLVSSYCLSVGVADLAVAAGSCHAPAGAAGAASPSSVRSPPPVVGEVVAAAAFLAAASVLVSRGGKRARPMFG